MNRNNNWQQMISLVISLSLLMQLAGPLAGWSRLAAVLADTAVPATRPESTTGATAVTHPIVTTPLTLSRVQSGYNTGSSITISYTVSNNQPPTALPPIAPSASVTDTITALAAFDITSDANTLNQVTLATTLSGGTLLSAGGNPIIVGSTLTWNLPPIPPMGSTVITMTVLPPASAPNFVNLDNGATAVAQRWGESVSVDARPAVAVPDAIPAAYTAATPDAQIADADLLHASAQTTQDPLAFFATVRGMAFEPYVGSLRGTRGTLWGEAGNSLDQSSLLIAALRAAGVPARYRHGSLTVPQAQTLLATMFKPVTAVAGHLPPGTETADPLNDPALLALTQDHWWVEAYLPGQGWTNLDPSFANAAVGQIFATPGANDRIAEIPAELRHTVTFRLEAEQYSAFPIGGQFLQTITPLETTYSVAELASRPLIFGHLVNSSAAGGVFTNVEHHYTPYFTIQGGDDYNLGNTYQDLLTTFPLASRFTTALWLTVETTSPDGRSETFTREIKDLLGQHARLGGGNPIISSDPNNAAFIGEGDLYVTWFLPNRLQNFPLIQRYRDSIYASGQAFAAQVAPALGLFSNPNPTPEEFELLRQASASFQQNQALAQAISGLDFALFTDRTAGHLENGLLVKLFYSQPRIITTETFYNPATDTLRKSIDLRTTRATTIVYPGQATSAGRTANWLKGVAESYYEGQALERFTGIAPLTTARIFDAMVEQGIEPLLVTPANAALLELFPLDPAAYAYAAAALQEGKQILIPSHPVQLDGQAVLGWWEIDPLTGETISVSENGLHLSLVEWTYISIGFGAPFTFEAVYSLRNSVKEIWDYVVCHAVPALGGTVRAAMNDECELENPFGLPWPFTCSFCPSFNNPAEPTAVAPQNATTWMDLPAHLCPIDDCGLERFVLGAERDGPMPLPDILFRQNLFYAGQERIGKTLTVVDNGSGGQPALTMTTDPAATTAVPYTLTSFDVLLDANFSGPVSVNVYAPTRWFVNIVGDNTVEYAFPVGIPAGSYEITLVAQAADHPDVLVTAVHTVTISDNNSLSLTITPETRLTVPMNQAAIAAVSGQTNDGEAEIPQSAYQLELWNETAFTQTITVAASGPPANWLLLNGQRQSSAVITLGSYERGFVGLAIQPPTGQPPAPGTSYPLNVTASSGSLNANASATWTMPGQPFNYLSLAGQTLYLGPDDALDIPLTMQNVGNAAGSFALDVTLPISAGTAVVPPNPLNLAVGQTAVQTITLNSADLNLGARFPLLLASAAPDGSGGDLYTQYLLTQVQIVSPQSAALFAAADSCTLNDSLGAGLEALATAVVELEQWCSLGNCPLPLRDRAAAAGQTVIGQARTAAQPMTLPALADVETAVTTLSTATGNSNILAAIADLSTAVTTLSGNLCQVEQHRVDGRFTPYVQAILLGDSASFNLDVHNQGTLTTTYAITITGLPGGDLLFNQTIPPGATANLPVAPTPNAMGNFNLTAVIVADVMGDVAVQDTAVARLNVVDKFVQITQVIADPPFVETGISATDLRVEVANFAGVAIPAQAHTAILAPDGSQPFSAVIPLNILAGNPRVYELSNVNTSGWAAGIYTVTVNLLDGDNSSIPDGSGYGYFSVGQALQLSQAVYPDVVAPGTVTVTTVITSEIAGNQLLVIGNQSMTMYDAPLTAVDLTYLNPTIPNEVPVVEAGLVPAPVLGQGQEGQPQGLPVQEDGLEEARPLTNDNSLPLTPFYSERSDSDEPFIIPNSQFLIFFSPAFTRTEQNDPDWSYTGTWTNINLQRASGGSHWRNAAAGSTAVLPFDGTWISLGFIADRFSGYAEIFIDGNSQGIIDLYHNEETAVSTLFDGLTNGTHTLVIQVMGSANPYASNSRVQLDYADFGDGSALPDGDFEQDDARIFKSNGWSTTNYGGASGGSYMSSSTANAWFPFTGDSFSLHTIAYSSAGKARLFVDGVYLDTVNMFAPVFATSGIPRVFSYEGLGAGPHVLQVMTYQNATSIDKLTTPGAGPFIDPNPPVTDVTRYEADYPAILYNGVPFTQTAQSWNRIASIVANRASAGEYIYSAAANDTISFAFAGDWLGIGFATDRFGGQAEIAIDGQPVQTVDLYSREDDTASTYFNGLGAGPHTVTITVLGTSHPNASGTRIHLDFLEVWDGQPLAEGTFEEGNGRLLTSNGWGRTVESNASGGAYANNTNPSGTIWFPFTGDSVTFQAWAQLSYKQFEIRIDGVSHGLFDLYAYTDSPRTFSFDGLGSGPHVLEVRQYRETVTVDAFFTPAIEPATEPPPATSITRYEENHPAMRYNGYPHRTMPQSWTNQGNNWQTSGSYNVSSSTAGNSWRLDFEGVWVNVGFHSVTGAAEIFIDGLSQGIVQTGGGTNEVINFPFANLSPGPHTVEVVVVSGVVRPDYIDVWDGQPLADGWYDAQLEEGDGRFHFSNKTWWRWAANEYAWEGDYLTNFASTQNNIWFTFTGTDLTVLGYQRANTTLHVVIDGVYQGVYNMTPPFAEQPFALHFPDLGAGAHVAQVYLPSSGGTVARVDAFHVNPPDFYSHTPVVEWYDFTAQESLPGTTNTGFATTIAIGDLNGDGVVELVAPGLNGRLYVYRGDGQDAGNGSPIQWYTDLVGPAAEPALADITGDGRAEIIISGREGTFAFTHDGNLLWHNPAVASFYTNEEFGWGGPSVGNLDLDPEPEIVIAASQDALYVLDHLGAVQWSTPIADRFPPPPVLADITGDGILDIVMADQWEMRVYDYFNGGQLVWSRLLPDPIVILGGGGAFGAPAVADLTGDGQPEIIINWGHIIEALHSDGAVLWRYLTNNNNLYRPSPVTVADVTGDGQMNIVTASAMRAGLNIFNHLLMVLDANGNLVWQQLVADNTASASGVAVQDLTGNGAWEILWNGATDGFLILRGADGKRLFNEPVTASGTVLDYPTLGDVDGDGLAEVVVSGVNGIFIIGHDGRWADSRPVWNQHNYHVTNINDDWSVPVSEPNSWELHNTYRTQTPDRSPAPAYQMVFTYTEGTPHVTVLTQTASIPLTANPPLYGWEYRQEWYEPLIATTFDSLLTEMQPGETRQVSAGTEVAYRLPSGFNTLTLPPLYVTAPGLGELAPAAQSVVVGGTAVYTLTLSNPGSSTAVYSLFPGGIPGDWLDYPATVSIGAGQTAVVPILAHTPANADPDTLTLWLDVDNGSGGLDDFSAQLTLFDGLALALTPFSQNGPTGQPLTYTLTISNLETAGRTYDLTAVGLADVTVPANVSVAGNGVEVVTVTAVPPAHGPQPFTITASASSGASDSVDGVAVGDGRFGILAAFHPDVVVTGPGATAVYTLTLTNVGDTTDSYTLSLDVPAGWTAELTHYGQPVSEISLSAPLYNSADLRLLVTPATSAQPGSYPLTLTAQSMNQPGVVGTAVAIAEVTARGVTVAISPANQSVDPTTPATWDITVTNVGSLADTFALTVSGPLAAAGELSAAAVTLAPGAAQTVQLTAADLRFLLPGAHQFAVTAQSQTDGQIQAEDVAGYTIVPFAEVAVAWQPTSRTVTGTLSTGLTFVISNTGNTLTEYQLDFAGAGLTAVTDLPTISIPAGGTAVLPVQITANSAGNHVLMGSVTAVGGVSDS
ncbi:MAG: VCBS repeat-containing protein, partial [Anaerolineae bacterium]|nr:VCBS repeat-containing protein [Anaerolineae bacterium]